MQKLMRRPRIYVAGPITKGDLATNIHRGILVGDSFIKAGFAPFVPHYSHYHTIVLGHRQPSYEDWLSIDFSWILASDVLWRMIGKSSGGDREVRFARRHGIPVFFEGKQGDYSRLMEWRKQYMKRQKSTKPKATKVSLSSRVAKALA